MNRSSPVEWAFLGVWLVVLAVLAFGLATGDDLVARLAVPVVLLLAAGSVAVEWRLRGRRDPEG